MSSKKDSIKSRYTISCTNVPDELFDKINAKEYFKKFGRVLRIVFRQKSASCLVDYDTEEAALEAIEKGRFFKNTEINIELLKNIESKIEVKKRAKEKDPDWPEDPELKAELNALSEVVPHQHVFRTRESKIEAELVKTSVQPVRTRKTSTKMKERYKLATSVAKEKLKRKVTKNENKNEPKKVTIDPAQVAELLNTIKQCAYTAEDKYRILDARDKLIRIYSSRQPEVNQNQKIIGTCPDMCPEKERFLRESKHQVSVYEQEPDDQGEYRMNHKIAIKQYSRSSADQEMPLPHELRPVSVLQLTMSYLLHNIMDLCDSSDVNIAEWYHFVWDRTRSIRKDITQQQLCCLGSVELVEQCARFHIHCAGRLAGEDMSVFDPKINTENLTKCLQTLKYMYHDLALQNIYCKNEAEFRGYIILLNLRDSNFMWEVKQLRPEIQKSKQVSFAIKVFLALDNNNFVSFFKLVRSTTYLNACILLRYFNEVRFRCISRMIRTHSPRALLNQIPIHELQNLLAFEDYDSTVTFLKYYGLQLNDTGTNVILDKASFSYSALPYELDRAIRVVESKKQVSVGEVVCGATLPLKLFENHIPQYSFDERGFLKKFVINEQWFNQVKSLENVSHSKSADNTIFAKPTEAKVLANLEKQSNLKSSIFNKPAEVANINIFEKNKEMVTNETQKSDGIIFSKSIFQKPAIVKGSEKLQDYTSTSIFKQLDTNIFKQPDTSLFTSKTGTELIKAKNSEDSTDSSVKAFPTNLFMKPSSSNIFASSLPVSKSESIFGIKTPNLESNFLQNEKFSQNTFKFSDESQKSIFNTNSEKNNQIKLEMQRKVQKEKELLEYNKKQEEIKKQQELELERIKQQKLESERIKRQRELELIKQREELERIRKEQELEHIRKQQEMELLKKEEEAKYIEKQKELERIKIQKELERIRKEELEQKQRDEAVKILMNEIIQEVENKERRLKEISENIRLWKLKEVVNKWQQKTKAAKKRKAVEDSPVWVSKRSHLERANDLYTPNQKQSLDYMKHFKFPNVQKITNLFNNSNLSLRKIDFKLFIYENLITSLKQQPNILVNTIFWKVIISVPDEFECGYHSNNFLSILSNIFALNKKSDNLYLDSIRVNNSDILNLCIETFVDEQHFPKKENVDYVFFGINNSETIFYLKKRIHFCLKISYEQNIIIILRMGSNPVDQETIIQKLDLGELVQKKCVKKYYLILENDYSNLKLIDAIEMGFCLLAKTFRQLPPLHMNLLINFLHCGIGFEFSERLKLNARENIALKLALMNVNSVISIYNEAIMKLKLLATDERNYKYPNFPDELKQFLKPLFSYPCTYEYFPTYWKTRGFMQYMEKCFRELKLPEFNEKWPPSDVIDLENILRRYCSKVSDKKDLDGLFLKILTLALDYIEQDEYENFAEQMNNFPWIDILQILILYNIDRVLQIESNFDKVVIYNKDEFKSYETVAWFLQSRVIYEDRSISDHINKINEKSIVESKNMSTVEDVIFENDYIIDEKQLMIVTEETDLTQTKEELNNVKLLLEDLDSTIKLQKKAVEKFSEIAMKNGLCTSFIENG